MIVSLSQSHSVTISAIDPVTTLFVTHAFKHTLVLSRELSANAKLVAYWRSKLYNVHLSDDEFSSLDGVSELQDPSLASGLRISVDNVAFFRFRRQVFVPVQVDD